MLSPIQQRFLFFLLLQGIFSCGITDQDAVTVPAYISVPSFSFKTDSITEGSNDEKFTDMWISSDGLIVGAVGLPTLLPVQKHGLAEIRVDAGIILTGKDQERAPYPLIASHTQTLNLKPGVADTIKPVFKYVPNIDVKFVEDYDRIGSSFKINSYYYKAGDTIIKVNDQYALRPGSYSGKIELAPSHKLMQLLTNAEYQLPAYGSPAYLEISYNSNLPLDIGYYTNQDTITHSVFQSFPSNGWRKVYINLTNEVAVQKPKQTFVFYILIYNIEDRVPSVYLDNIKLLCLKN